MKVSVLSGGGGPSFAAEMIVVPWIGKGPLASVKVPGSKARLELSVLADITFDEYLERHGAPLKKGKPLHVPIAQNPFNQKTRSLLFLPLREDKGGKLAGHEIRRFAEQAVRWANDQGCGSVGILLDDVWPWTKEGSSVVQSVVEAASLALYRFDECSSKPAPRGSLRELVLIMEEEHAHLRGGEIEQGQQIAEGISLARDLILLPPNWKKPVELAERIRKALLPYRDVLAVSVVDRAALENLGANGILAVGGAGEPVLVRIAYRPPRVADGRPPRRAIALVGKGVTMDTGGYGIKPANGQKTMKGDCAGAAAVVGTMRAIAALRPATPVVAYLPLVENLISERAMLTSDVYRAVNGKTVEVMHTDAEGRLILADALALACRELRPQVVIDIATLTGAVVASLGSRYAGLFATSRSLADKIERAGRGADERFWRLPVDDGYLELLQGGIADLKNIGNGPDALLAAIFLRQFVSRGIPWAHLDIAGVFGDGIEKGKVPGFGVGTLTHFVLHHG